MDTTASTHCGCKLCEFRRKVRDLLGRITSAEDKALVKEMHARMECAEVDAAYWQSKHDGTWPSAPKVPRLRKANKRRT